MTPRRRQAGARSLRLSNKPNIVHLVDEDEIDEHLSKTSSMGSRDGRLPSLGAHFSQESIGRGRLAARDDGSVGATSLGSAGSLRSRSSSRTGRYGYVNGAERLCLSAVPSTPKKSVGLAALLYCNPLDLGKDEEEPFSFCDTQKSPTKADVQNEDESKLGVQNKDEMDIADHPAVDNKAQAKKDYWKAKLAGKD
jgi:hypothetical protein